MSKTACIFGSTGLVGSLLLEQLVDDNRYNKVIIFNRSKKEHNHPKISQVVGDYKVLIDLADELVAHEYYCCLGTTMKKAKTKEAFEYVDYQLPLSIAQLALKNNVEKYLVVSSIGASAKSSNFYLRTKGKMEQEITGLNLKRVHFFRPSLLLGTRNEKRFGESMAQFFSKIFGFLMIGALRKYRAIRARTVAAAMINIANQDNITQKVFLSGEIEKIGMSFSD